MPESYPPTRLVLTTAADHNEAARLAHTLVEEGLAACATLIPGAESIYRWQGEIETSRETLIQLKTGLEQLPDLETRLKELHSYQTPECLVLAVDSGSRAYLEWLHSSLRPA